MDFLWKNDNLKIMTWKFVTYPPYNDVIIFYTKEIMFWVCYPPTLWQIVINFAGFFFLKASLSKLSTAQQRPHLYWASMVKPHLNFADSIQTIRIGDSSSWDWHLNTLYHIYNHYQASRKWWVFNEWTPRQLYRACHIWKQFY